MPTMTATTGTGADLRVGDFVDRTYTYRTTGPRGGRYEQRAVRVESTVTAIQPTMGRVGVAGYWVTTHAGTFPVAADQRVDYRR